MFKAVFRQHAELLKALANPKRLEVVHLLSQGQLTVSEMKKMLGLTQANLSQHLMVLRKFKVVKVMRQGKERYYSLSHINFAKASALLRTVLIERLGKQVSQAAGELRVLIDPECGMRLTPVSAVSSKKIQGQRYYFCGSGCEQLFIKKKYEHK